MERGPSTFARIAKRYAAPIGLFILSAISFAVAITGVIQNRQWRNVAYFVAAGLFVSVVFLVSIDLQRKRTP